MLKMLCTGSGKQCDTKVDVHHVSPCYRHIPLMADEARSDLYVKTFSSLLWIWISLFTRKNRYSNKKNFTRSEN